LLASTLSQGIPLATSEESKRNELLAQLILGDSSGPKRATIGAGRRTPTEAAAAAAAGAQRRAYQQTQPQGLLMCAAATNNWSSSNNKAAAAFVSATPPVASYSQQPNRHIPVATLPTKPLGSSRMQASATVTSAEAAILQPLNLSKRIESAKTHHLMTTAAVSASNHATAASVPPTSVAVTASASNGHDIPTEA
jgi:hypothetical protein